MPWQGGGDSATTRQERCSRSKRRAVEVRPLSAVRCRAVFTAINLAYGVLSDPDQRAKYDYMWKFQEVGGAPAPAVRARGVLQGPA